MEVVPAKRAARRKGADSLPGSDDHAALVEAAKGGDRDAFERLVRLTYTDVYTLAYRLTGDQEDARDVVQEAYLRAFRGIRRFRGEAQFSTWMYRITANCAATHLGKRSRSRHEELSDDTVLADDRPQSDPHAMAEGQLLRERMNEALADLPPKLRAVVVLRDVYDLPHEAIARELGITEAAAKVRLHRARRRLRERLFPMPGEESAHAV
jgi:RNA polymerase sigma-70 factor (ECF subfamily)